MRRERYLPGLCVSLLASQAPGCAAHQTKPPASATLTGPQIPLPEWMNHEVSPWDWRSFCAQLGLPYVAQELFERLAWPSCDGRFDDQETLESLPTMRWQDETWHLTEVRGEAPPSSRVVQVTLVRAAPGSVGETVVREALERYGGDGADPCFAADNRDDPGVPSLTTCPLPHLKSVHVAGEPPVVSHRAAWTLTEGSTPVRASLVAWDAHRPGETWITMSFGRE